MRSPLQFGAICRLIGHRPSVPMIRTVTILTGPRAALTSPDDSPGHRQVFVSPIGELDIPTRGCPRCFTERV